MVEGRPLRDARGADGGRRADSAGADGAIELWAADAKLHGGTIRVEYQHPRGNAGFWTSADDYIEWFVDAAGEYEGC